MKRMLVLCALAALLAPTAAGAAGCKVLTGDFSAVALAPFSADCPSFFCTQGTLTGGLPSTYYFVADTPTATGFTGHSTVTTKNGVIHGDDVAELFGPPVPGTAFRTTVTVASGTRKYNNVTGTIVASGTLTETGTAGTYVATLCRPDDGDGE